MTDIDVCVGNNTIVDAEVYQLWLKGLTGKDLIPRFCINER